MLRQKIRDDSPDSPSFQESQESHEILVSKHLIPPPLTLLPKEISYKPKSLLPMVPLPNFIGIIPSFQPLRQLQRRKNSNHSVFFNWIGDAFDNIIYRKYEEASYCKIDDQEENWNIWACDVAKLLRPKVGQDQVEEDALIQPFYQLKNDADHTLIFQSRFESGNLSLVSKVTDNEYNLLLQNDINTNGYSQWFFFKVLNGKKGSTVKFNILNLYKHSSLYKAGMKIVIYSIKQSEEKNLSWHRGGQNIEYYENGYSKNTNSYQPYFTLSWDYTFPYDDDEVYFAYSYPYTYTNQTDLYDKIFSDHFTRSICRKSLLCKTLAGNPVDVLTITEDHPFQELDKGYIIITSRIHPGETVSSYVCNGILDFLLSANEKARKLRHYFVFKIIPMLNPDGVIHGNYRSNISGYDLNRKWQNPSKTHHSEIYHCKKLIQSLNEMGEVVMFCDLHGHSSKKNAFIYGSHDDFHPKNGKQFPFLLSKLFKGFSFRDCSFLKRQEKEGTTREVLLKEVINSNVYTLESSFCGPQHEDIHFTVRHFQQLGEKFCESLLLHFKDKIKQMQIDAAMKEKSHFPVNEQDSQSEDVFDTKSMLNVQDFNQILLHDRVNSENSQGSEQENERLTMLEEKTIKKYLLLKNSRPQTSLFGKRGLAKKNFSKDLTSKLEKKVQFHIHKSNSPTKRKDLYELPRGQKYRPKIELQKVEKLKLEPKIFQPIEFMSTGLQRKKNYKSTGKIGAQSQRPGTKHDHSKSTFKLILNKNYEFKSEERESVFRNSCLKGFIKQEPKKQRRVSEFIIRKNNNKMTYNDEKNSTNLFKSVLSSLRRDRR